MADMHLIRCTIAAACVLHNFILKCDEYIVHEQDEFEGVQEEDEDNIDDNNGYEDVEEEENLSGVQKRNEIVELLN